MYRQKGTGGARHGNKAAPQFRGGGKAFGPVVHSHAIDLPKKVRALALEHALSAKAKADAIIVLEDLTAEAKTKALVAQFAGPRRRQCADHRRQRDRARISAAPPATSTASTCCRSRASTSTTSCAATPWS